MAKALPGLIVGGLLSLGCAGSDAPAQADAPACVPSCAGRACGGDGCGGSCGACGPELTCSQGACVAPVPTAPAGCEKTCADLGLTCGDHCGVSCGTCGGAQDACIDGHCACQPACSEALCGQGDGCGGACGPCASTESCAACTLRLSVVDQVVQGGVVQEVTLALDFAPPAGKPLPSMADLRIAMSGPAEVKSVGVGPTVMDAKKELYVDGTTGKPFRVLPDGSVQVLIFSTGNTATIAPGRLLVLRVRIHQPASTTPPLGSVPAVFKLVEREETFAPAEADAVLWGGGYGGTVSVWPEVGDE